MREMIFGGILLVAIVMILMALSLAIRALSPGRAGNPEKGDAAGTPGRESSASQARSHLCKVVSSRTIAPLLREIVLSLPEGATMDALPGMHVKVTAPPYAFAYSDYAIATEHRPAWDQMGLWGLAASSQKRETRPYWIANTVEDGKDWIVLLVRLALPPPDHSDLPPGTVSSWLFALRPGDDVEVAGPFGSAMDLAGQNELVLAASGEGLAPVRSILSHLLDSAPAGRSIRFWCGARNRAELPYREEFERLAGMYPSFSWHDALTEAGAPEEGLLHHRMCHELLSHPAPEECTYLLYGPPLMIRASLALLDDLGVPAEQIYLNGARADRIAEQGEWQPAIRLRDFVVPHLLMLRPEMEVLHALRLMLERQLAEAPVVSSDGNLLGMLVAADCLDPVLRASWLQQWGNPVSHHMRREPPVLDADLELTLAAAQFFSEPQRRFQVVEDGRLLGEIGLAEVQRALIDQWR